MWSFLNGFICEPHRHHRQLMRSCKKAVRNAYSLSCLWVEKSVPMEWSPSNTRLCDLKSNNNRVNGLNHWCNVVEGPSWGALVAKPMPSPIIVSALNNAMITVMNSQDVYGKDGTTGTFSTNLMHPVNSHYLNCSAFGVVDHRVQEN